jgi:transcriptional/translational regulatory protein YebC/TACO1
MPKDNIERAINRASGFNRIPQVTKALTAEQAEEVEQLLEKIEEDDVQNVFHSMEE